jgi:hypothetical protein
MVLFFSLVYSNRFWQHLHPDWHNCFLHKKVAYGFFNFLFCVCFFINYVIIVTKLVLLRANFCMQYFKKLTLTNHVIMHKVKSLLCMARRSYVWPLAQGDGG